ncbi:MAG: aldose 1-epimerase [Ktedonobacterales bacterium]|nr:aldose 1-epimerase [Ktedonobacterales bacterium]
MTTPATLVRESLHGWDTLVLANACMRARLLLDKGGDLYELIYQPRGIDVLWKTPWGLRPPLKGPSGAADSQTAWLEQYGGGWQVLMPNGGDAGAGAGTPYPFHGEAAVRPWTLEGIEVTADGVTVRLRFDGFISPTRVTRTLHLPTEGCSLRITETVANLSPDPVALMWVQHPGFGSPFVDGATRIDTGANRFVADDRLDGAGVVLAPGSAGTWPVVPDRAGQPFDLRRAPGPDEPRAMLGYLHGFGETGWFALTSLTHGFGVGVTWPTDIFPTAWWWQEAHATPTFPWFRRAYVVAVEPATSAPNHGLARLVADGGTPLTLAGGEQRTAELRVVFYKGTTGVTQIAADGTVTLTAKT